MRRTIAVLNQKGGVGKTTIAVHLAAALSREGPAHLVDADPQRSAGVWWHVRYDHAPRDLSFSVGTYARENLHEVLAQAGYPAYDWVVIDGPPGAGPISRSAILAADLVIVPVLAAPFDVWADAIVRTVEQCGAVKPQLVVRTVVNQHEPHTILGREILEELRSLPGAQLLRTSIRRRTEYPKAARFGLTAFETDPTGAAAV